MGFWRDLFTKQNKAEQREDPITVDKKSKEPQMVITNTIDNQDGTVGLEADWNDAFIKELKKAGYAAPTDEQMVQKYIAVMHKTLMEEQMSAKDQFE